MKLDDRDTQARYEQAQAITQLKEAALGVQQQNAASQDAVILEAQAGLDQAYAGLGARYPHQFFAFHSAR